MIAGRGAGQVLPGLILEFLGRVKATIAMLLVKLSASGLVDRRNQSGDDNLQATNKTCHCRACPGNPLDGTHTDFAGQLRQQVRPMRIVLLN